MSDNDKQPLDTGSNPLSKESDLGDWRVINKKSECDTKAYEDAMKEREAKGFPRMNMKDWLDTKKPMTFDP